jgi:hypothetical protein
MTSNRNATPQELVDTVEAARRVGRSVATLRRWQNKGIGPDHVFVIDRVQYDASVLTRIQVARPDRPKSLARSPLVNAALSRILSIRSISSRWDKRRRGSAGAAMDILMCVFPDHSPSTLSRYKSGPPRKRRV